MNDLEESLAAIESHQNTVGPSDYWIDMESRVRSEGDTLSGVMVSKVLRIAAEHRMKTAFRIGAKEP